MRKQYTNPRRAVERSRKEQWDRTLSSAGISALPKALAKMNVHPVKRAAIQIAMLTDLRISLAIYLRWDCVDFESRSVLLPTTKTGRRVHPLSTASLDILVGLGKRG